MTSLHHTLKLVYIDNYFLITEMDVTLVKWIVNISNITYYLLFTAVYVYRYKHFASCWIRIAELSFIVQNKIIKWPLQ